MSHQPKTANDPNTTPATISQNGNGQFSMDPQDPTIPQNGVLQLTVDTACTMCFSAQHPFGGSKNFSVGTHNLPVGGANATVTYCITSYGGTCTPPARAGAQPSGTIKVGSGTMGGGD